MDSAAIEQSVDGRYRVIELLGRGGMGAVYRVHDEQSGRELALKRLLASASADAIAAELFEREFHTLSQLAHPRIIEVYEYGVDAAGAYYTMELLGGQDLRTLGKTDWRTTCALLRDVASSLALLHSRRLVHGDVSPRNVRCTLDGCAKLLDFGAMMPMGVAKRVVGTPPFVAPEIVQLQLLDGRTDLYALGALGYFLLTGRHAYPAHNMRQLRDLWQKAPPTPVMIEPDIPAALSQLVMELLQLNNNARPRSAGVVMERLCAIASLPFEEQAGVAEAYLTTPTLVGRDEQLMSVRRQIVRAVGGRGGVLVVPAPSGSGRSRFLDACVLEAKLLGCNVLRADAGDAGQGSYGVLRVLCQQLFALSPQAARRAARLQAPVLAHVIGSELAECAPSPRQPERRKLLAALRDFVLSAARSLRLLIAVDDADRIDEASASLLVALSHKAHHRTLSLIVTMDSEGEGSAALDLLKEASEPFELPPLLESQTEQLLRSVFGAADHLLTVARHIHATAHGNPRAIMQLANHLVTQGIARYEAGTFILPDRLREDDLPSSLGAALASHLAALDPDALELARVLSLTDPRELPTASYVELTSHGDRARTYRAIDELVRVQVLGTEGDRYRLSEAWRSPLRAELTPERRIALHRCLASVFEHGGSVSRRAHHLMESEQSEAAIRVLLTQYLKDPNEPRDPLEDYVPGFVELLQRAVDAAEALRLPAPLRMELRMKTAGASQFLGDIPRFLEIAPPTLAQLQRESGLADYDQLDASMEPMARLTEALTRVQQRYDATPEVERGLAPVDAVRELSRLCVMFGGVTATAQDPVFLEALPSIAPLAALSPAIGVIQQFNDAILDLMRGRSHRARAAMLEVIERLEQPDRAGLGELYHKSIRLGALYILGLLEAAMGLPDAGERMTDLEREPGHRVNAQRVHLSCHLMQGNAEEAAAAQRRAELVMLQDGQQQRYPNSTARIEMYAYSLADDITGMKQVTERIAKLAERFPRWKVLMHVGRCHHRRMQGDYAGALDALRPGLDVTRPLNHREWAWLAATHVSVLIGLGRIDEAEALGRAHMQVCQREDLNPGYRLAAEATADALLAKGSLDEAVVLADAAIAEILASGARGLVLGTAYERCARIAIAQRDTDGFRRFANLCAAEYRPDRNPLLAAKYARLLRAAEQRELEISDATRRASEAPPSRAAAASLGSIQSRLARCMNSAERARCALAILVEVMQPEQAYLYGLQQGQVALLCSSPQAPEPEGLKGVVKRYVERELEFEEMTAIEEAPTIGPEINTTGTSVGDALFLTSGSALASDTAGRAFYPLLLATKSAGDPVIAAVVAMRFSHDRHQMPPPALIDALAGALIENDDVDPLTCVG